MAKNSIIVFIFMLFASTACRDTPAESSVNEAAPDSAVSSKPETTAKMPELSGKAEMVAHTWKAVEFSTPDGIKLSADLIDIKYDFKRDGAFECVDSGKQEAGTWKADEEGKKLTLDYGGKRTADYEIKELMENKMVISGKENGMFRTLVLAPAK